MKTKRLLGLLLLILSITGFVACSDDGPQDKVKTVKMLISDKQVLISLGEVILLSIVCW